MDYQAALNAQHKTVTVTEGDIQGGQKTGTLQILTDFQTYFSVSIRKTFVIIMSLKIPPHLKCVSTLPCEMSVS